MSKIIFNIVRDDALIELSIEGSMIEGERTTFHDPGYPDTVEITSIELNGEPWRGELSFEEREDIEHELLDKCKQDAQDDEVEAEIAAREADDYYEYSYNLKYDPYGM